MKRSNKFWYVLAIILSILAARVINAQGRFPFPDSTKSVIVRWHPDRTGAITRGYNLRITPYGLLSIFDFTQVDSFKILLHSSLGDSAKAEVAGYNDAGQSAYTLPAEIAFIKASIIPPVTPPAASSLPFADSMLTQWTYGGPWTLITDRPYDFGKGLYTENGWITRYLSFPKGQIKITIHACGFLVTDKLTVSIGTMTQTLSLIKGNHYNTTIYPHEFHFQVSYAGPFEFKIAIVGSGMMKKVTAVLLGRDTVVPNTPWGIIVEVKP